jgi:peptidoglycan/LPS O-acetylase OafA/YrhL
VALVNQDAAKRPEGNSCWVEGGFCYHRGLDGLRGLAVMMVLLLHSKLLPFGWIGVQIFFVLSGFLITSILVAEKGRPFSEYIGRFYWKRSLRIWPLYFFYVGICGAAYFLVRVPETFPTSWLPLVTYTYNFARISPHFADSNYFGHLWTLCIEEQFYLIWPFALYFFSLRKFRAIVISLIVAGPLFRFLSHIIFAQHYGDATLVQRAVHNLTSSHFDAFASGALIAIVPVQQREWLVSNCRRIFFGAAAVMAICGLSNAYVLFRHGLPPHWLALGYDQLAYIHQYVWGYTLINLVSAGLILCLITRRFMAFFFEHRFTVYVGAISYGIYVWHLPLLQLLLNFWPCDYHSAEGVLRFFTLATLTLLLASVSYFCFEKFFLRLKNSKFRGTVHSMIKFKHEHRPAVGCSSEKSTQNASLDQSEKTCAPKC